MSQHCSGDVLLALYYANIHSCIRYGILNWGTSAGVGRVFLLQKYAVRILGGLSFRESCRETFQGLGILTVAGIYILEICSFVYLNKSTFQSVRTNHRYDTRTRHLLLPDLHRTALYRRNIAFGGCRFFNALDDGIKYSPNIKIFKRRLKQHLLNKNCYSLQEFFS